MNELIFYVDDSGTRSPDRKKLKDPPKRDWFGLGGVLIRKEDEQQARDVREEFCAAWNINYPLHSENIRFKTGDFNWLKELEGAEQNRFYRSLGAMLTSLPVRGLACTIDRPGYNHRYYDKYGRERWSLCKTAFSVIVERAVKWARIEDRKLRIYAERADKDSDSKLRQYYQELRTQGMPFTGGGDVKYKPLSQPDLHETLREFRLKFKSSPMVQLADLYLYPMCRNGYEAYRPYDEFRAAGRLVNCELDDTELPALGIKYSCFDLVKRQAR